MAGLELPAAESFAITRLVETFVPRLSASDILALVDILFDELRERERLQGPLLQAGEAVLANAAAARRAEKRTFSSLSGDQLRGAAR